jgi:hypothetical protein
MMRLTKLVVCLLILAVPLIHTIGAADFPSIDSYARVLQRFVDPQGQVDYRGLKAEPDDLELFLEALNELEPRTYDAYSEPEKIAFWVNAYNALTLKVIIDFYPIRSSFLKSLRYPKNSIRQIPGAWSKITFPVMGERLTLDHIEHEILRKEFKEPRIHMALVCAARGCPILRQEPFVGGRLGAQLDDQTRTFLSDPNKFVIDEERNIVFLSSIFKWFGEDFIEGDTPAEGYRGRSKKERAVLHFVSRYVPDRARKFLADAEYRIKHLKYDWTLNERGL